MGKVKIMSASAGSGKTYSLAYEYIGNVVANPRLYKHILAVTFTNKATAEMKERILAGIDELANGRGGGYRTDLRSDLPGFDDEKITANAREARSRILHDYGHFSVLTIDAFFQQVIRAFLKELGIGLNFNIELKADSLLGNAAGRLIDEASADARLRRLVETLVNERMDDGKSWNVRQELTTLGQELFREEYKSRVAGSATREETEALFRSIMEEGEKAKKLIADSGKEFLNFVSANGLAPENINRGATIINYALSAAACDLKKLDKQPDTIGNTLESGKWHKEKHPAKDTVQALAPRLSEKLQAICATYEKRLPAINTARAAARHYNKLVLLEDLRRRTEDIAREENLLYISEVNGLLSRLVAGNDAPFIYEKAGNYFSHFMIDEFQDTSAMQWDNFVPLLHNALAQTAATPVLLVGDVKQSIYRWRGGDWSILAEKAPAEFPDNEQLSLSTNYRSRAEVVKFINAVTGRCVKEETARLDAKLTEAESAGRIDPAEKLALIDSARNAYRDYAQAIPAGREGGCVTITNYATNDEEEVVPPVIERITDLQERGYSPRDIAVLVRSNRQAQEIARMLLEHKKENPGSPHCFDVITQEALLIGKAPVANFITACLRMSVNPADSIARAQYNQWLGRGFGEVLPDDEKQFIAGLQLRSPEEAFESTIMRFGLDGMPEETAYLQALHSQIISFTEKNIADIPLFLQWWDESGCKESISLPEGANAITIDTIHKSKGLGFKSVIIPYCNWSMNRMQNSLFWASPEGGTAVFPVNYEQSLGNSAFSRDYYREYVMSHIDSLNMFYVAVTRAKEELHIMIPPPGKLGDRAESIDNLIKASLEIKGGTAAIEDIAGSCMEDGSGGSQIIFGTPSQAAPAAVKSDGGLGFGTTDITGRVKMKLTGQRWFDDGAADSRLAPRNYGILMHGVFENATDLEDIRKNLTELKEGGSLSSEEAAALSENLDRAMSDEQIRSWFDGSWEEVRNESDIILPGGRNYRPDRVMAGSGRAVVVDYKFGALEDPAHRKQVSHYTTLLSQMGYTGVKGYVWYIGLGKIVEI